MIGPFIQIISQIVEALRDSRAVLVRARAKEAKRSLVRLLFALLDFEDELERFLVHIQQATANQNRNSLRSAIAHLTTLKDLLDETVRLFYAIVNSEPTRFVIEVHGAQVRHPLASALGADMSLLHEWSRSLGVYVHEIQKRERELEGSHVAAELRVPTLDEQDFLLEHPGQSAHRTGQAQEISLSQLVTFTEQWLKRFREVIELYRELLKGHVTIEELL